MYFFKRLAFLALFLFSSMNAYAMTINLISSPTGDQTALNATQLAAFERAAGHWEALFTDPITINLNVYNDPFLVFDEDTQTYVPSPSILGGASNSYGLFTYDNGVNGIKQYLEADIATYDSALDDYLATQLPTAANRRLPAWCFAKSWCNKKAVSFNLLRDWLKLAGD